MESASLTVFGWIGQLVAAGGGGALVAFAIFRTLGKSWIDNRFAKDLESAKSEISLTAARRMKLHDMEYVVFPELWSKLNDAVGSLGSIIGTFREMPDFGRMTQDELDAWVTRTGLSEQEKSYFLGEDDKMRAYDRILDSRGLERARKHYADFHQYLQQNRIFVDPSISTKFDEIDNHIRGAWVAKKMDLQGISQSADKNYLMEAWDIYDKKAKPLIIEIENLVQAKLFPANKDSEVKGAA